MRVTCACKAIILLRVRHEGIAISSSSRERFYLRDLNNPFNTRPSTWIFFVVDSFEKSISPTLAMCKTHFLALMSLWKEKIIDSYNYPVGIIISTIKMLDCCEELN